MDRATFLEKARSFKREEITVDLIGTVYVREVSASEAREQNKRNALPNRDELADAAWLVTQVVCDEHGQRVLTDADIEALKEIPIRVLSQIADKSAELSGTKKKSTPTTPASGSPSNSAAS